MADSCLGDGLIHEESLPVAWIAGPPPEGAALARLNADNQQLLAAEASVDEVRVNEALNEESPALLHELQRLEFKLNLLLRLTAELAARDSAPPPRQAVRFSARGLEWFGAQAPMRGEAGQVALYLNPVIPQPLRLPATVVAERIEGNARVAQLRFDGLSEALEDMIEKLIFRHHRRLVAGARQASG